MIDVDAYPRSYRLQDLKNKRSHCLLGASYLGYDHLIHLITLK